MKTSINILIIAALFSGCQPKGTSNTEQTAEISDTTYRHIGDSITLRAQQTLVNQVLAAIGEGGATHAVTFCSLNAEPITDSLSDYYAAKIQRISSLNRNSGNTPATETDSQMLAYFSTAALQQKDTVIHVGKSVLYYKPIRIGMTACLQCHGDTKKDIAPETLALLQEKYPQDKAIGYKLGDFRGLWKLTLKE
ncbi:MAG TPA: DUF3365 domain-containing protein [Chitinophagales bacterium]|nr:DUF3365 domain-containing protein [Chitinophagales bacterium]